ncbi:hypothetical protein GCM10027180_04110 [Microbulbifer echini]
MSNENCTRGKSKPRIYQASTLQIGVKVNMAITAVKIEININVTKNSTCLVNANLYQDFAAENL